LFNALPLFDFSPPQTSLIRNCSRIDPKNYNINFQIFLKEKDVIKLLSTLHQQDRCTDQGNLSYEHVPS
jgi:hypothetical protein